MLRFRNTYTPVFCYRIRIPFISVSTYRQALLAVTFGPGQLPLKLRHLLSLFSVLLLLIGQLATKVLNFFLQHILQYC